MCRNSHTRFLMNKVVFNFNNHSFSSDPTKIYEEKVDIYVYSEPTQTLSFGQMLVLCNAAFSKKSMVKYWCYLSYVAQCWKRLILVQISLNIGPSDSLKLFLFILILVVVKMELPASREFCLVGWPYKQVIFFVQDSDSIWCVARFGSICTI